MFILWGHSIQRNNQVNTFENINTFEIMLVETFQREEYKYIEDDKVKCLRRYKYHRNNAGGDTTAKRL